MISKDFVERTKNFVHNRDIVKCPYKKYSNMLYQRIETEEVHNTDNIFHQFYMKWTFHEEVDIPILEI